MDATDQLFSHEGKDQGPNNNLELLGRICDEVSELGDQFVSQKLHRHSSLILQDCSQSFHYTFLQEYARDPIDVTQAEDVVYHETCSHSCGQVETFVVNCLLVVLTIEGVAKHSEKASVATDIHEDDNVGLVSRKVHQASQDSCKLFQIFVWRAEMAVK